MCHQARLFACLLVCLRILYMSICFDHIYSNLMYPFKNSLSTVGLTIQYSYLCVFLCKVALLRSESTVHGCPSDFFFFSVNSWELHLRCSCSVGKYLLTKPNSPSLSSEFYQQTSLSESTVGGKSLKNIAKHSEGVRLCAQTFPCDGVSMRHTSVGAKSKAV